MGTFNWPLEIRSADGQRVERVEALVDTGASYTILPDQFLRELGILPTRSMRFEYGDGRRLELEIGEARVLLEGREHTRIVVFGEDESTFILGADTLQGASLAVDPVGHRLIPTDGLIKRHVSLRIFAPLRG
jgi:predicted aspartyl protease